MNASPEDQRRLLDIADLDARIKQAERVRNNPPQAARVQELIAARQQLSQELTARLGARDDIRAEIARIEADVNVVDARMARDNERMQASSNPKEIDGFEHELASLTKRKSDLEDAELELMENLEAANLAVTEQEQVIAATNEEGAALSAQAKQVVAEATSAIEQAQRDRAAVAASVSAPLLAAYDRLATRGIAAALLRRKTCEACRMELSGSDIQAVRETAEDVVVNCPECGAILVRTDESGL